MLKILYIVYIGNIYLCGCTIIRYDLYNSLCRYFDIKYIAVIVMALTFTCDNPGQECKLLSIFPSFPGNTSENSIT